jgi:GTP-binding protein
MQVTSASFTAGARDAAKLPPPALPEIAFAGRSNVGKSSLLNALAQRKSLVRTSSTPGCTRQINLFTVTLKSGLSLCLVDLPGYGYARVSKSERKSWGPMLEGYLRERPTLRAVVVIVDVRRGLEEEDAQLLDFLSAAHTLGGRAPSVIVVATKVDKLPRAKRKPALKVLGARQTRAVGGIVAFSAVSGPEREEGRAELWRRILRAL